MKDEHESMTVVFGLGRGFLDKRSVTVNQSMQMVKVLGIPVAMVLF
jgi:hypothetical protein